MSKGSKKRRAVVGRAGTGDGRGAGRGGGDEGGVAAGSPPLDRHDLYEICVQSPRDLVPMLRGIHGGMPRVLGEDFAGTAACSHLWVAQVEKGRAIAIDLDAEALARHGDAAHIEKVVADVLKMKLPEKPTCDVIFVGNFSIGYLHDRRTLVKYLKRCAKRLKRGGVFVCDTYGGASTFTTGHVKREHRTPDGRRVLYTWEQRDADPISGRVTNAMHFQVDRDGEIELRMADAFVYSWRVWSIPELADAMREAGFREVDVYDKVPSAMDGEGNVYMLPVEDGSELEESFIVCVAGRV